jgi:methyltransferase (TIGR00027 family)
LRKRPSYTAYKIAIGVVMLGADPVMKDRIPADAASSTARLLVDSGAAWRPLVRACLQGRLNWLIRIFERLFGPQYGQLFRGIGHRKIFCERQVREGIAEGAKQVLVLGAGYDTLCWRLAREYPDVQFLELDHPATGRLKAKGLEQMGTTPNLHLIQADLSNESLESVLKANRPWDVEATSVVLAEGLLMYLTYEVASLLLTQCNGLCGPGTRFAFDYLSQRPDGQFDFGRLTRITILSLKLIGEPLLWGSRREEVSSLFRGTGWDHRPDLVGQPADIGAEGFAVLTKTSVL